MDLFHFAKTNMKHKNTWDEEDPQILLLNHFVPKVGLAEKM
jgi:hypothetical protein